MITDVDRRVGADYWNRFYNGKREVDNKRALRTFAEDAGIPGVDYRLLLVELRDRGVVEV